MSFFSRFSPTADPGTLSPAEFAERRQPTDPVLDVRTPGEFSQGRVAGARNIDFMAPDFRQQIEALDLDPSRPVYLYCRSGNRSGKAAGILREMGFEEAYNVGGLNTLAQAGIEVER